MVAGPGGAFGFHPLLHMWAAVRGGEARVPAGFRGAHGGGGGRQGWLRSPPDWQARDGDAALWGWPRRRSPDRPGRRCRSRRNSAARWTSKRGSRPTCSTSSSSCWTGYRRNPRPRTTKKMWSLVLCELQPAIKIIRSYRASKFVSGPFFGLFVPVIYRT